jgi:hypothetical protein
VAKVETFNPDRTISLKGCNAYLKNNIIVTCDNYFSLSLSYIFPFITKSALTPVNVFVTAAQFKNLVQTICCFKNVNSLFSNRSCKHLR